MALETRIFRILTKNNDIEQKSLPADFNLLQMDLARATLVWIRARCALIGSIAKNLRKLLSASRSYFF